MTDEERIVLEIVDKAVAWAAKQDILWEWKTVEGYGEAQDDYANARAALYDAVRKLTHP